MSTVRTNNILDASGGNTATINSMTPTADSLQGFRNRIINGDMRIDQRNAGASVSFAASASGYTVDRMQFSNVTDGAWTAQRSTTTATGFTNSLLLTVTTADASLGATQFASVQQLIEGFNVADFGWGTASAKTITLSFWVRSSLTGTFGGAFVNSAQNRSYPFTYTINSANTFEYKTVTVAGDTSGTWLTDNGIGIRIYFGLGVGSTYSGTSGAWGGALYLSATGATSVVGTSGATFYITGVQLEVGSVATPFERRDYGRELMLCQRYAYKLGFIALCKARELDRIRGGFYVLPVEMRAAVTVPAMATTDSKTVSIANQTTRGFTMGSTATADGETADITSQLVVTAEL